MSNILILGAGAMGTAFSFPCSDNGHSVSIVGTHLENSFIDKINSNRYHPFLNCKIPKNVKFFKFEKLKEEINNKIDLIVVAVSSNGIDWVASELSKFLKKNIPILMLTKGLSIYKNNFEVLSNKLVRLLTNVPFKEINISVAGGPCLAKGLSNKVHTSVVYANSNIKTAKEIANIVSTDYYHVFTSDDTTGVQICAAIKNIFSMAIGASHGLCRDNVSN